MTATFGLAPTRTSARLPEARRHQRPEEDGSELTAAEMRNPTVGPNGWPSRASVVAPAQWAAANEKSRHRPLAPARGPSHSRVDHEQLRTTTKTTQTRAAKKPRPVKVLIRVLAIEHRSENCVELRGFEPLTFCMPCMLVSSDGVGLGPVAAVQSSSNVQGSLARSGRIWVRWYLVWSWFSAGPRSMKVRPWQPGSPMTR
jgi:hypothetical protein